MKKMKSYEIRQMWLDFWASKGHEVVPSASLVPVNDPTLLWINAGVAPLKKYFDGREVPTNRRLTNAQKAIRTNDIENVGKTARHHTFFEMLGNFSIGDYFRKEAITWGYELLTSEKWFGFDKDRLYFTAYTNDSDTINTWISLGVKRDHIIPLEDNYWDIGEGPCGPDTEIFFDRGEKYDPNHLGIELLKNDIENDRYIEIWNIVLSQFNHKQGLKREEYPELPSKNIDTGMGLERMACVMQEVDTNYETDLFMPIIDKITEITNIKYTGQMAFKVICDHVRSVTFAVSDGAMLSNEGRGYVLRRILRRAVRYGKKLGMNKPFLYELVDVVCEYMSNFYPYLLVTKEMVKKVVKLEEEKFLQTLENGEKKLLDYMKNNDGDVTSAFAFQLYDTFGFPIELTLEICSEQNRNVDLDGFKTELLKQKQLARANRAGEQSMNSQNEDMLNFKDESLFIGYTNLSSSSSVIGIFKDGENKSMANGEVILVFDKTVFYATSGGQIGDSGKITFKNKDIKVLDSFKLPNNQHAIKVDLGDEISIGDIVELNVDETKRNSTSNNHSATHLLNEALRQVLGRHVVQQGSSVNDEFLRFDFNNFTLPTTNELLEVEKIVNDEISKNVDVNIVEMPIDEAKKLGVQAVFGEKYGNVVRVVTIGFSKELCGGTHVKNTSSIKRLAILNCESKGSGIFRIVCCTGNNIISEIEKELNPVLNEIKEIKHKINDLINISKNEGIELEYNETCDFTINDSYQSIINAKNEVVKLRDTLKELDKQYNKLKIEKSTLSMDDYLTQVKNISGINALIFKTNDVNVDVLKDLVDRLSDHLDNSIIVGCNINTLEGKIVFIAKNKVKALSAGNIVKTMATTTKGGGGGRNDFAQAGGKDVSKLDEAIALVFDIINNVQ